MKLVMTWGLLMTLELTNTFKPILSNPTVWDQFGEDLNFNDLCESYLGGAVLLGLPHYMNLGTPFGDESKPS